MLRKPSFVSFCVEVWILFSVFLICCITSFGDCTPTSFGSLLPALRSSVRQVGENPGNEVDCTHLQHRKNFPLIFACPVEQSHASLVCFLVTTDLREPSPKRRVREVSWCCRVKGCLSKGQVKIRAFFKALQYESSC